MSFLSGLLAAGAGAAAVGGAYNQLGEIGEEANAQAQDLAGYLQQSSNFQPFGLQTGTGASFTTNGNTTTLDPGMFEGQFSNILQASALQGLPGNYVGQPQLINEAGDLMAAGSYMLDQAPDGYNQITGAASGLFGNLGVNSGRQALGDALTNSAIQNATFGPGQGSGILYNQGVRDLNSASSGINEALQSYGSPAAGASDLMSSGQGFLQAGGDMYNTPARGQNSVFNTGQAMQATGMNQLGQPVAGLGNTMLSSGIAAGQGNSFLSGLGQGNAAREADVYERIRATQRPEEERQRLALEERLFNQGRGDVSTAMYGGTPEQLAMEKANAEARNTASLMALQQGRSELGQDAQIGSSLAGLGASLAGQGQSLQSMQQDRALQGIQSGNQAVGQAQGMGLARNAEARAASGLGQGMIGQQQQMQLAQDSMALQRANLDMQRQAMANQTIGQAFNQNLAQDQFSAGMLGMANSFNNTAEQMYNADRTFDVGAAQAASGLYGQAQNQWLANQQQGMGLLTGGANMLGMNQQMQNQAQNQAIGQMQASYIPQAALLDAMNPAFQAAGMQQQANQFGTGMFGETSMAGLNALLASGLGQANLMGEVGAGLFTGGTGSLLDLI